MHTWCNIHADFNVTVQEEGDSHDHGPGDQPEGASDDEASEEVHHEMLAVASEEMDKELEGRLPEQVSEDHVIEIPDQPMGNPDASASDQPEDWLKLRIMS